MLSIVEVTFRYLADRPQVHSEVSGLPFMVSLSVYNLIMIIVFHRLIHCLGVVFLSRVSVYCSARCIKTCHTGISSVVWGSPTQSLSHVPGGITLIAPLSTCRREWSFCPSRAKFVLHEVHLTCSQEILCSEEFLWTLKITSYQSFTNRFLKRSLRAILLKINSFCF